MESKSNTKFVLEKTIDLILAENHKVVILQFPDSLLSHSYTVKKQILSLLKEKDYNEIELILAADK